MLQEALGGDPGGSGDVSAEVNKRACSHKAEELAAGAADAVQVQ